MSYTYTKSKAAFLMSASKLFNYSDKVYFWTFTWPQCMPDHRYYYSWNSFLQALKDFTGNSIFGLRVWEVHPAEFSHGLHCHALINKRISIHIMRRIAKKHGLGHCWVCKADIGSSHYLSKYMTKENQLSQGMRQWGTIGGFKGVKVNKIKVESMLTRNIAWIQQKIHVRQLGYAFFLYINAQTLRYGRVQDWPTKKLRCVTKYSAECKRLKDIQEQENDRETAIEEERKVIYQISEEKITRLKKTWDVRYKMNSDLSITINNKQ